MQTSDRSLVWNTDLMETMELENLLINAAITMHSAERRKVRGVVGWGICANHHVQCCV
jgi:succinate dehydrogenase/fumarate reductase flavoprotein subunit